MDIGEKLGAEAAGLVKTEVLDAWTCLTGSRPIFIQARPMRPHTSQGRLFAPDLYRCPLIPIVSYSPAGRLVQQFFRRHTEELRQGQQVGGAGVRRAGLPFADRLPADPRASATTPGSSGSASGGP